MMIGCTKAMAIVVGGVVSTVLGNFFLLFSQELYPVKTFYNSDEAMTWLLKQK